MASSSLLACLVFRLMDVHGGFRVFRRSAGLSTVSPTFIIFYCTLALLHVSLSRGWGRGDRMSQLRPRRHVFQMQALGIKERRLPLARVEATSALWPQPRVPLTGLTLWPYAKAQLGGVKPPCGVVAGGRATGSTRRHPALKFLAP